MSKILLVEDEEFAAFMVSEWLQRQNNVVDTVTNGNDGLEWLTSQPYDLAIVDWGLPGLSGVELCLKYRALGGTTPILMLTGKDATQEKTTGLDSGADDYITKPFDFEELSARVRALLRRPPSYHDTALQIGDVRLDPVAQTVMRAGEHIHLAPKEFAILHLLMRYPNQVFSSDAIVERVWSTNAEATGESIRPYINRIRTKLSAGGNANGLIIETVHGSGYKVVQTS